MPLFRREATPQHLHAKVHTSMVPKGFTVVRNPFARVASEYKMRTAETGWSVPFPAEMDQPGLREPGDRRGKSQRWQPGGKAGDYEGSLSFCTLSLAEGHSGG